MIINKTKWFWFIPILSFIFIMNISAWVMSDNQINRLFIAFINICCINIIVLILILKLFIK